MDRAPVPVYPMGQRFLFWLGQAAREMRVAAGVKMPALAMALDRSDTKPLERFERAENFPQSLEELLAVYGELIGCDPRLIVERALEKWREHGEPPQLASTLPAPQDPEPGGSVGAALEQEAQDLAQQAKGKAARGRGSRAGRTRRRAS